MTITRHLVATVAGVAAALLSTVGRWAERAADACAARTVLSSFPRLADPRTGVLTPEESLTEMRQR